MFGVGMALSLEVLVCSSQHAVGAEEIPRADAEVTKTLPKKEKEMAKKEYEKVVARRANRSPIEGTIVHYEEFPSELIRVRPVNVWLPEGYDPASSDRYPVIYMHDGQMMFDHDTSPYAGMDVFWDVDKAITKLVRNGEIRPAIVVAVWMASWAKGARGAEYMPQKVVTDEVWQLMRDEGWGFAVEDGGQKLSADNYLKFIVHELKPFIDATYRTESDRGNTLVMGSSMGGLISAYAVAEYPGVFGGAACLSTDWRHGDGAVVRWLGRNLPSAGTHRIYFDHGTETYDAHYGPFQQQMDEVMRRRGYTSGDDWITLRFEGADHSPRAWRERLHIPLKFLLGTP
ncbi:MAG: alpha/beta hydrolase-fold protein [Gammaproteobacteria bacterium]|nr:alpha/beta hydrolase-fold protein [Gammaproteobacteria bacterium]